MYAFSTLTAASLLFATVIGVYSQEPELIGAVRHFEVDARDIVESPDNNIALQVALDFIDRLCGQPDDQVHGEGMVSGAFNRATGEFRTWWHYLSSPEGGNRNYGSYLAEGNWQTFWGHCSLKVHSTWEESGPRSNGKWRKNQQYGPKGSKGRTSEVLVTIPGFWASTTMPSWKARCSDSAGMAARFTRLLRSESLQTMVDEWIGLRHRAPEPRPNEKRISVSFRHQGRAVALTVVRVVHTVQVFRVMGWYWHYSDVSYGWNDTWMALGSKDWENVYTFFGYVDAYGAVHQQPQGVTPGGHEQWDPRVTFSMEEIPLGPNE